MRRAGALILLGAAFVATVFLLPTLDYDEALYRRIAEEMKASGAWLAPTWNGAPNHDKPPLFFWLLVGSSLLFDGPGAVSAFACRVPSFVASAATALLLARSWPRLLATTGRASDRARAAEPLLAWASALLPIGGATAVLLDPLLAFATTLVMIELSLLWLEGDGAVPRAPLAKEVLLIGGAIGAAFALKGPIALVLPVAAVAVHATAVRSARAARAAARRLALPFALGGALGALVFLGISASSEAGATYVRDFLWVHNLGRGLRPMQGHGGPLWYHPLAMLLTGGGLTSAVLLLLAERRPAQARSPWLFPWSFAIAVVLVFSAVATKLPSYTWPAWTALALGASLEIARSSEGAGVRRGGRLLAGIARLVPAAIATALLVGAAAGEAIARSLPLDARSRTLVEVMTPLPWAVRIGTALIGLCFVGMAAAVPRSARGLGASFFATQAALTAAAILVAVLSFTPFLKDAIQGPLDRLGAETARRARAEARPLETLELFSPTLSSRAAPVVVENHGLGDDAPFHAVPPALVLLPVWSLDACARHGYLPVRRDGWLALCERAP
jgi:4-amino-4-deoxy-L-arabinose transferase-like glycosyltransferase